MSGKIISIMNVDLLIKIGIQHYDSKNYAKAKKIFKRILEINSLHFEAHFYLSAIYEIIGEYDKAISEFEILIKLRNEDYDLKEFLLHLYIKKGQYRKAINLFRVLLEKDPYSFKYWEMFIDLLIKANKFNFYLRKTKFLKTHRAMVNDVLLRTMLIYRDSDQLTKALLIADTLINIDSKNPINHYFVGTIYEALNDTDKLRIEFNITSKLLKNCNINTNILYQEIYKRLCELGIN